MSSRLEQLARVAAERGQLARDISTCQSCALSQPNNHVLFTGPAPSPFMLIGDQPGAYEAKSSRAWSGSIQTWLAEMFKQCGLPSPGRWFATNAIMCHPFETKVETEHLVSCAPLLRRQVALCDPRWIVTMGGMALRSTGARATLGSIHGHPFLMSAGAFKDRWILPTYSPFAAHHSEKLGPAIAADLAILRDLLSGKGDIESLSLIVGRGGKLLPRV